MRDQQPEQGPKRLRVAIAGLGAIGMKLVETFDAGLEGFELAAIAVRDKEAARRRLPTSQAAVPLVDIGELEPHADIVVECAPAALIKSIVEPFVTAGKQAIVLSCGALLVNMELVEIAKKHGGQIIVPSGALLGLDAVTAAAQGRIHSVRMITRKPPKGLVGAPYLVERDIDLTGLKEPLKVFSGTARDAAVGFPANLNVAVALSLAGTGPDQTRLDIWADPGLSRNTHTIEVDADSASFSMSIENIPSENPKTGRITALSVIATLKKMHAPIRIGT